MNAVITAAATVSSQATLENGTAPYSRPEAMTSALTPADARARLRELAPQVREALPGGGVVFAARSQRHAAVVVARRGALPGPVLFGLRRVLQGLEAARE